MEYRDRTVVITGGGSGLGAAMADLFAAEGASLALLDIDIDRAEAKAKQMRLGGCNAMALRLDVADPASLEAAVYEVERSLGGCHVVCANVGVQQFGKIDALSTQDWEWVLSVNVRGVIDTVTAFLPLLRKEGGERHVLLTASSSYFTPGVRMAAYVTSKYAVVGYGEVLRQELAEEGINVSLLFPGGMSTRHLESSRAARPPELGESRLEREDIDAMMASAGMVREEHVASAGHAVRNLLEDLRNGEPYIITHGNYRSRLEARHKAELRAFDRMRASE